MALKHFKYFDLSDYQLTSRHVEQLPNLFYFCCIEKLILGRSHVVLIKLFKDLTLHTYLTGEVIGN